MKAKILKVPIEGKQNRLPIKRIRNKWAADFWHLNAGEKILMALKDDFEFGILFSTKLALQRDRRGKSFYDRQIQRRRLSLRSCMYYQRVFQKNEKGYTGYQRVANQNVCETQYCSGLWILIITSVPISLLEKKSCCKEISCYPRTELSSRETSSLRSVSPGFLSDRCYRGSSAPLRSGLFNPPDARRQRRACQGTRGGRGLQRDKTWHSVTPVTFPPLSSPQPSVELNET